MGSGLAQTLQQSQLCKFQGAIVSICCKHRDTRLKYHTLLHPLRLWWQTSVTLAYIEHTTWENTVKEPQPAAHSRPKHWGSTVLWCAGKTKSQARGLGCCLALLSTAFKMTEHNSEGKKWYVSCFIVACTVWLPRMQWAGSRKLFIYFLNTERILRKLLLELLTKKTHNTLYCCGDR